MPLSTAHWGMEGGLADRKSQSSTCTVRQRGGRQSFLHRAKWGYNEITEGGRTGNAAPSIETHKYHYCQNTLDLSIAGSPHATWLAFICPGWCTLSIPFLLTCRQRLENFTLIADRLLLNHSISNGFPLPTRVEFAPLIR